MSNTRHNQRCLTVAVPLSLIQDLEVVKPLIRDLIADQRVTVKFAASTWLLKKSPRVKKFFTKHKQAYSVFNRRWVLTQKKLDFLNDADYLLLPCESSALPHIVPHHFAKVANARGVRTITFQHGLENAGLNYFTNDRVTFASDIIVTWSDSFLSEPKIRPETKKKCMALGIFKDVSDSADARFLRDYLGFEKIIGVFENLHWGRFDHSYRAHFIDSLIKISKIRNDVCFMVKPHHEGQWMKSRKAKIKNISNIKLIDPTESLWESFTGNQLVAACDGVITTPSTIAVDAALCSKPVAIVANGIANLDLYSPLSMLRATSDWLTFVDHTFTKLDELRWKASSFKERNIFAHNPCEKFKEKIFPL